MVTTAVNTVNEDRSAPLQAIEAAIQRSARLMTQARLWDELKARAGINIARAEAAFLRQASLEEGGVRLTDLAQMLGIAAPSVTRDAQRLERQKLVHREVDPEDKRAWRIHITPEGRNVVDRLLAARRAWLGESLAGWSVRDMSEFARLLDQFASDIGNTPDADSN